ncbi:MAG: 30S ribosomal protein S3ae [Methanosarcinaceae archaeon]|nr:30S ribosomal protein S3ae [Methanosarcinaceae archaeon]
MARRKQQKKVDSWRDKKWYNVEAPGFLNRAIVGQTIASDPALIPGRIIETTVGEMTNDMSKNNIKMRFKVKNVSGNVAQTEFIGHTLTNDYIRSMVKRQTSRIDVVLLVRTADGYIVSIKPTSFTVKRARASKIKGIRKLMTRIVVRRAVKLNFEDLVQEVITGRIASTIYKQAKNIYPLRRVEIRKTEVIKAPVARKQTKAEQEEQNQAPEIAEA